MEWFEAIIGAIGGGLITAIGSIFYFRPKLREAKAEASKVETEASVASFSHLLERIGIMEQLYKKQGEVIDDLQKRYLSKIQENFDLQERIQSLENENKSLSKKVENLQKSVNAYKTIKTIEEKKE